MESTVPVSPSLLSYFDALLKQALYGRGHFAPGKGLRLDYRFIQIKEPGVWESTGPIWDRGPSLAVEVTYRSPDGDVIGVVNVECQGTKFEKATERAAGLIGQYTKATFQKADR